MNLSKKKSKGQAVVEFAITLPLILSALMGTIELSNMLLIALRLSNLSREAANAAFRECVQLPDADQAACLSDTAGRILADGSRLLEEFAVSGTVIVSTYVQEEDVLRRVGSESAGGGGTTHFDTENIDPGVAQKFKRLAVGEVFYSYQPMTPIGSFLSQWNSRPVLYEATVF